MCTVAPIVLSGLAGVFAPRAAPVVDVRTTMATYVEGALAALRGYGYDDDDIEALLREIDAFVNPPTPAGPTPQSVAAGSDAAVPMPSVEFLALSRQDEDADFEAFLRSVWRVHVPAAGLAPVSVAADATPTTPVAVLGAPRSYGDDDAAAGATIKTPSNQQPEPFEPYDAHIDASLRAVEKDPAERPSAGYLWTTQEGEMTMAERAELVAFMHDFSGYYDLAPGTLHRAVSYVDRVLSAKKIDGGTRQLRILGAAAVFAAAKYEDRSTTQALDAEHAESTRREVVDAEHELVAVLGYHLSGPTAYTFVDHFTRRGQEDAEGSAVRSLAYHLADLALLDYRCVRFLPSVVASSAIVLTRLALEDSTAWSKELTVAGYALEDLTGCMDAMYDMHEHKGVWPGCARMMADCLHSYSLPSRSTLIDMH